MQTLVPISAWSIFRPQARLRHRLPIASISFLGALLVIAGASLPWLSFFAGLQTFTGTSGLDGRLLVGGGVLSAIAALWYLERGSRAAHWAVGLLGVALLAFCGWLLIQLLGVYREVRVDPFIFSRLGPGLFLATGGAATIAATLLLGRSPRASPPDATAPTRPEALPIIPVLAALSLGAGIIHCSVIGPHWRESIVLAVAFAGAGVAQILWAWLVLHAPGKRILLAGAVLSAVCVVVWALSRTVGLPVGDEAWRPEPVAGADLVTVAFEALTTTGALLVWGHLEWLRVVKRWPAAAAAAVAFTGIAAATLLAVLDGTGALALLGR